MPGTALFQLTATRVPCPGSWYLSCALWGAPKRPSSHHTPQSPDFLPLLLFPLSPSSFSSFHFPVFFYEPVLEDLRNSPRLEAPLLQARLLHALHWKSVFVSAQGSNNTLVLLLLLLTHTPQQSTHHCLAFALLLLLSLALSPQVVFPFHLLLLFPHAQPCRAILPSRVPRSSSLGLASLPLPACCLRARSSPFVYANSRFFHLQALAFRLWSFSRLLLSIARTNEPRASTAASRNLGSYCYTRFAI